ncbi:MAG: Bax inhibitor-1 family protein [Planctomycetes bacterium]|nr:Bax inhibitor-1 family protein [Planctomycetota bacterium]
MSFGQDYPLEYGYSAESMAAERAGFIRRTYAHLAGAIVAFTAIETFLLTMLSDEAKLNILRSMLGGMSWLLVLGAFIGVGWIARYWARNQTSVSSQYLGLGLYIVAECLIFLPLLIIANWQERVQGVNILGNAAILTLAVAGGLTTVVFVTKKDFSFMGPILSVCTWVALGFIICGILFGFSLGLFFVLAMIGLMSGWILYETSNVLHHYPTDMHVAAALELFAAIATLFWYIVQLLMQLSSSRD